MTTIVTFEDTPEVQVHREVAGAPMVVRLCTSLQTIFRVNYRHAKPHSVDAKRLRSRHTRAAQGLSLAKAAIGGRGRLLGGGCDWDAAFLLACSGYAAYLGKGRQRLASRSGTAPGAGLHTVDKG